MECLRFPFQVKENLKMKIFCENKMNLIHKLKQINIIHISPFFLCNNILNKLSHQSYNIILIYVSKNKREI